MTFHQKVKNHEFVLLSITTILRDTKKGNLHAQLQHESISHANVYPWKRKNENIYDRPKWQC